MNFSTLKKDMKKHLDKMFENDYLFVTDTDKEVIWEKYLESFPPGTNKVFRERREYDCSCCKHFIRSFGNVVAVKNNKLMSIWDFKSTEPGFQCVIDTLSSYVKDQPVRDFFVTKESRFGTDSNREVSDKGIITWEHFFTKVPEKFITRSNKLIGDIMGSKRDSRNVFYRSLTEISLDAVETVLDIISQKNLYKGDEWRPALVEFKKAYKEFQLLNDNEKILYVWANSEKVGSIAKIKNHSIGVLLTDLTEGKPLDVAVKQYENIVAPHNYKRPKALYTKKMVQQAKEKIIKLGYQDSLGRRYANIHDINVNDILFFNKDVVKLDQDVFDILEKNAKSSKKEFNNVPEIQVKEFITKILPESTGLEILFENSHKDNLVSLIAPANKDSKSMFKWNNSFCWAYDGNITDSRMKQAVRDAGGKTDGVLRFSIMWNDVENNDRNKNDFDAHCIEPNNNEIFFENKERVHPSSGMLDVDIINPSSSTPAVENITWTDKNKMKTGTYHFFVHNYSHNGGRTGFKAEIEFDGQVWEFEYQNELKEGEKVTVAKIEFDNQNIKFIESLDHQITSKEYWDIETNNFHPVSVCMYSPNHWENTGSGVGNKHYFFMIDQCINQTNPNGFFNEFLTDDLREHRKVLEALGKETKVKDSADQLSGLGFSSTKRNHMICKVSGNKDQMYKVIF